MQQIRSNRSSLIVLGASNVVNCTPEIAAVGQSVFGPFDLFLAAGHGRSYLKKSTVLWRTLPGISDSRIWSFIKRNPEKEAMGVITDIGNDILYEVPIKTIGSAVKRCTAQLLEANCQVSITGLPVESVSKLGKKRYLLMRSILFPGNKTSLPETMDRVHQLEQQIDDLSREFGIKKVKPKSEWFGFDPIHIRRRHRVAAWSFYLQKYGASHGSKTQSGISRVRRWNLRFLRHETKWLFGMKRKSEQPTRELTDGSRVFLF